ncbi:MAG: rRNA maturation RNase YbeY [Longimonas sp.]|uniref:rRNA maturation RNase YbeY n=1 Tax=Longimonas sp. TaxID=2039626 RepID=UPI0033502A37
MITIETTSLLSELPVADHDLVALLTHVGAEEKAEIGHVTVILGGHDLVRRLNVEYLEHDYNTDVLAFNLSEPDGPTEGEIYVDVETAQERHTEFDTTAAREVARYAVHGLLHLVGYSDKTEDGQAEMRRLEDRYLTWLDDDT